MHEQHEADREERIRQHAYRLWMEDGRPDGRAEDHWDRATELVAIEDNQHLATKPVSSLSGLGPTGEPVEPSEPAEHTGEYPTMTDQGEQTYPPQEPQTDLPPLRRAG